MSTAASPVELPDVVLKRPLATGRHLVPEDGMCLMEAVSVMAGVEWSDSPVCTNPTLALLARLVNDAISDGGRSELVALVPTLSICTSRALTTDWVVVDVASRFAATRQTRARASTMRRWMSVAPAVQGRHTDRPVSWLVRQGPARRAVEAAVAAAYASHCEGTDQYLIGLLRCATRAALAVRPAARETPPGLR